MSYTKQTWANGDIITAAKLNHMEDGIVGTEADVADLKSALLSGAEEDAIWHLGFYLDENGDLCQVEEETNNG